ncbi:TOMM biosynthesis cyclodehydratase protein C [Minicystis rosea]|nr:TOMM biosynthesis cyclodehydratase protein C [Minicystis rosea]
MPIHRPVRRSMSTMHAVRAGASRAAPPGTIRRARVLLVGLTPWGVVAAMDLAAAGIGALHLVDDAVVSDGDLNGARVLGVVDRGAPRAAAVAAAIARRVPPCKVTSELLVMEPSMRLGAAGPWDLALTCAPADDLLLHEGVARLAHTAGTMSLTAYLEGADAVIGPAVIPGRTACLSCARQRRIANGARPALSHALTDALLERRAPDRERTHLAPAAGALGHAVALAVMDLLERGEEAKLAGAVAVRSLVDLTTSLHAVIPMPRCALCGGAEAREPREGRVSLASARNPAELRRLLAGIVDARTGIVHELVVASQDSPYTVDLPITARATLGAYSPCARHGHAHAPEDASGKGLDTVTAMIGAVGEAVERYAAGYANPDVIVRAAAADLEVDFIPPERLNLYADHQYAERGFPYRKIDARTPIDWTPGRWLDTGAPVLLPALPTYYSYHVKPDESFCQVTSNGLAAGPTVPDASLRAVLELVERDAFTLSWLARRPGRRIVLDDSVDRATRELDRKLVAEAGTGGRCELHLLDVGLGIPTIMCVIFGDGVRWPGASIALAAHPSPRVAVHKALLEHGQIGPFYRRLLEEREKPIPARPEDVHTLEDHALYYFPTERARAFDFLTAGEVVSAAALAEPEEVSLRTVVSRIAAAGLRVAVADLTSPDLLGTPFRVVRALGPDFQQIHFGQRVVRLDNPRLSALTPHGINPDPHPMD